MTACTRLTAIAPMTRQTADRLLAATNMHERMSVVADAMAAARSGEDGNDDGDALGGSVAGDWVGRRVDGAAVGGRVVGVGDCTRDPSHHCVVLVGAAVHWKSVLTAK